METSRFRHRIEYTRNKHSRAVYRGNTIIIRLARNLSKAEEQEHIRNLLRRMAHLILREREKTPIDPFRPLLSGGQSLTVRLATGRRFLFTLHPGPRTRAVRTQGGWRVTVSPLLRRRALHRFLWSLLARTELPRMQRLVEQVNRATLRVLVRDVRLQFATTQWGSCSTKGAIMLNTTLLFLPPSLVQYVIVHELAHRRIANHSPAYWRIVAWALPHFRRPYGELQEYRLPLE